jgi:enamine deaminase RidA (YjgF/YER057c/UK114 family)
MTTPTLNEACTYGADFSRGLRVTEDNKIALLISGTASVDEAGRTAHAGDFASQAGRMLLNVETLLAAQSASFQDVLSAVTYIKRPEDAPLMRRILNQRGLGDLPNAVVHAAVCRPDLLCEMEAVAALPLTVAP